MKKLSILIALMVSTISLTYAQEVKVVTDSVFNATISSIRLAKDTEKAFYTKKRDTGRYGLVISGGAKCSFWTQPHEAGEAFDATLAVSQQFGKNGGAFVGVRVEGGNFTAVEGFYKQSLGRYHHDSWIIPEIGIYAGASEQLMWCGVSTDPAKPQGVAMALACKRLAFCASMELSVKLKPAPKKEPRFFIELYGGYRITPYHGKEMRLNYFSSSDTKVFSLDNPLSKQFGHGYVGVSVGFQLCRKAK
ncbi:MAG: hypothetical protein IKA03_05965 [Alphaproteobacteria bacterium]|nr:hypothetical protein [Alphaproteobacteria bacterium]